MNVAALKQGLANRGLGVGGNKAELASRLLAQVGGVQQVQADAQPPPAVAAKQPKYKWVDIADHTFTPRTPYAGSDLPKLHADFANLTTENRPHECGSSSSMRQRRSTMSRRFRSSTVMVRSWHRDMLRRLSPFCGERARSYRVK